MGDKIILTGANGNLGRVAVETLKKIAPKDKLVFTSSKIAKIQDLADEGYECREANFNDVDQMVKAFEGGDTLALISLPQVGAKRRQMQVNALLAAKKAGVRRICYTSVTGADILGNPSYETQDHHFMELLIPTLGFKYVFLRNSQYAEAMVMLVKQAVATDHIVRSNQGDGKMAYVSRKDCAEALAYAAAGDYDDKVFYINGPRLCTLQDFCDVIQTGFGGSGVKVEFSSDEETYAALDAIGVPRTTDGEWATEAAKESPYCSTGMVTFGATVRAGMMATCTDDFEKLTGHKAISLEEMAANIDDFMVGERNATD